VKPAAEPVGVESAAAQLAEWSPLRLFSAWRRVAIEFCMEKWHRPLREAGCSVAELNDAIAVAILSGERMEQELRAKSRSVPGKVIG
jgi:hypothetical protein